MAGKTRRQFGRIEKLPSGRYRVGYTGPDGILYRADSTFDAKEDAVAWLSKRRAEITMGVWSPETIARARKVEGGTFEAFAESWLKNRRQKGQPLKPRTREHYRSLLDNRIYPTFGDVPIDRITTEAISDWYDTVAVGKPTTQAHAYGLLRTILGSAVEARVIPFNPCHIRGAGRTKPVHKTDPASLDELEAIVEAMPDRYKVMALLAAWCAMRFGELAELRRGDIDLKRGVVKIRRAVVRAEGTTFIGTPKSDAGTRDVTSRPI